MTVLKIKLKLYAVQNWLKGYGFGWVQRFRCCGHTTPVHYGWCASHVQGDTKPWRNNDCPHGYGFDDCCHDPSVCNLED